MEEQSSLEVSDDNDIIRHYNSCVPGEYTGTETFKGGYKYISYTEVSSSPRAKHDLINKKRPKLEFKKSSLDEEA